MSPNFGEVEIINGTEMEQTGQITKYRRGVAAIAMKRYTKSVYVMDKKAVLAQFLQLEDMLNNPHVTDISFACKVKPNAGKYELELSWLEKSSLAS